LHNRNKLCGACSMAEVFETGKSRESGVVSSFGKKWILGGYPVSHAGGKVASAIEIAHDITTIKQAEEEIKSHQEHITLINQILRHDLTNDLVVIQSAISLYKDFPEEELLEEISSHAEKSVELIKRMGALETFMSTHRKLKVCEIRDVIDESIKSYAFIDFAIKGKARVMADESLSSVIDNIIRNAVIHGKADRITMTTGKERDMCEVRIADNGSGIPDDIKERIFEEGFIHGDAGNTGIGLHIVQKAMESYGGYVWAEDNESKGTVIVLRFRRVK
ncbi:MAG: HAMP domain-containing histidine kinase, partial [Syntrophobacterales bacterium]|nr:HAMP domain-containing histidine kinase [Syntrophobacterales bacterium]